MLNTQVFQGLSQLDGFCDANTPTAISSYYYEVIE